jgi:hypothetical protein
MSTGGHHDAVDRGRIKGGPGSYLGCLRRVIGTASKGAEAAQQAVRAGPRGRQGREGQIARRQNGWDAARAGSSTIERGRGGRGLYSCAKRRGRRHARGEVARRANPEGAAHRHRIYRDNI